MDGPRVSVLIVMRVIGFQSSRDQVVGLIVKSQWSQLLPHWSRSKSSQRVWSHKSCEWLIEHSITRGKIERPPTEMVLGIYNHTKWRMVETQGVTLIWSLAQCRTLSQISNVAPLTEDMALLSKERILQNHSKHIYCKDFLSSSFKEYA